MGRHQPPALEPLAPLGVEVTLGCTERSRTATARRTGAIRATPTPTQPPPALAPLLALLPEFGQKMRRDESAVVRETCPPMNPPMNPHMNPPMNPPMDPPNTPRILSQVPPESIPQWPLQPRLACPSRRSTARWPPCVTARGLPPLRQSPDSRSPRTNRSATGRGEVVRGEVVRGEVAVKLGRWGGGVEETSSNRGGWGGGGG